MLRASGRRTRRLPQSDPTDGRLRRIDLRQSAGRFAGRLIEAAGLKGFAIGPVSFSTKHSNFIVNAGGGTAVQVLELIDHARQCIRDRFGVNFKREIELPEPESKQSD